MLDPQARSFIAKLSAAPSRPPGSVPLEEFRAAAHALASLSFDAEELPEVRDIEIGRTDAPALRVRLYRPRLDPGLPLVVWAHGGSWVRGDLATHDTLMRTIARRADCAILAVDYRLSPEARFPDALDDVHFAARWAQDAAGQIGADPARVAIAGDSSGGNLAAAVALRARDAGDVTFAHQALLLPIVDLTLSLPSWDELGDDYLLTRDQVAWAVAQYAPAADLTHPLLSPLFAPDHAGLPPALIVTAEYDPLRDDGERYARALQDAGVPVQQIRFDGMTHHTMLVPKAIDLGRRAVEQTAAALGAALSAAAR